MGGRDEDQRVDEQDRLPWLEAVDDDDMGEMSASKLLAFLLLALVATGLVIGGVWWLRSQKVPAGGNGQLIAAQEGDYKVPAKENDGLKVEGQGDATFAASEGAEAQGKLAVKPAAETPIVREPLAGSRLPPVQGAATGAKPSVEAPIPASAPKLPTPIAPAPGGAVGRSPVQLGAYGSQAAAEQAWATMVAKHSALRGLTKAIVSGPSGGKTVYRLRAMAASPAAAAAACSSIKSQGGSCLLP